LTTLTLAIYGQFCAESAFIKGFVMPDQKYVFTSESVGEGHPDKLCDRVSDAIVDAYLNADPHARTAVECLATTGFLCIAGETRGPKSITKDIIETVARHAVRDIGYKQDAFHWEKIAVDIRLHAQSADIAQGVDAAGNKMRARAIRASCSATPAARRKFMPAPFITPTLSEIARRGAAFRRFVQAGT